jgi:hypothetical protein
MDSLIRIDDVIQNYVIQNNPLHGAIIADYVLNVKASVVRDNFWTSEFRGGTAIQRTLYTIKQSGTVFWTFFLKYALPTAREYFGWVRSMLLNIACFEKLHGIKAEALLNITLMERTLDGVALFLGYRDWSFANNGGNQYAKDIRENPPAAYNFILSLFPKDRPDAVMELERSKPTQNLLAILKDACVEVMTRLRDRVNEGHVNEAEGVAFTRSDVYIKCHTAILGPNHIGETPNPYLRYPEVLTLRWDDFIDQHTTLDVDHGNGPLIGMVRDVAKETPMSAVINELMFYSNCLPVHLERMIPEVVRIRGQAGLTEALNYPATALNPEFYSTHLLDSNHIQLFNYNIALGLLLSEPIPLQKMDVDAGPSAPLQKPKLPKPKKKEFENSSVFWLIGLAAIGFYAVGGF